MRSPEELDERSAQLRGPWRPGGSVASDERYPTEPVKFCIAAIEEVFSYPANGLQVLTEP